MPGLRSPPSLLPLHFVTVTLFPLSADLRDRPVLVVGGGTLAERRVEALLSAGAILALGAVETTPALAARIAAGQIQHLPGQFSPHWLDRPLSLVIAASDDAELNRAVTDACVARGLLLEPATAPARTPTVGSASASATPLRSRLAAALSTLRQRFRRDRPTSNSTTLLQMARSASTLAAGSVTLVGAGPGDPGLLTLHAARALAEADVILYDRLVSTEVLQMARGDAERIAVGKAAGGRGVAQEQTHAWMLEQARRGRRVVRLKGGDPFVFGRGGEELQFLRAHGIGYRVIPGITAALACAAYAGVPLTHRDHAQSLRLVTAHCKDSLDTLDWPALSRGRQTLAFYMGVAGLETIQQRLLHAGRGRDTAFALIENGSRPEQRVLTGTLATLAATARQHAVRAPALLIVGEVATLATSLHWFGQLPLSFTSPSVAPVATPLADAA